MKVAFCLYGQPRMLDEGYKYIQAFMNNNKDVEFDFFYHTWYIKTTDDTPLYYESAPWRNISINELIIKKDIINRINELYKPKVSCYDPPMHFDSIINPSIIYENTKKFDNIQYNISNSLSLCYSCQKVRNILLDWIKKTNIQYDFVIASRFDFLNYIHIILNTLDSSKLYTPLLAPNRYYIPGAVFYITNIDIFSNLFNTYDNIDNIKNNTEIFDQMNDLKEIFVINGENIMTANFLYYYKNFDNVIQTSLIPNFC
jgi:hypothetical protein